MKMLLFASWDTIDRRVATSGEAPIATAYTSNLSSFSFWAASISALLWTKRPSVMITIDCGRQNDWNASVGKRMAKQELSCPVRRTELCTHLLGLIGVNGFGILIKNRTVCSVCTTYPGFQEKMDKRTIMRFSWICWAACAGLRYRAVQGNT